MNLIVTPNDLKRQRHNSIVAKLNEDGNKKARAYLAELKAKQGIVSEMKVVGG